MLLTNDSNIIQINEIVPKFMYIDYVNGTYVCISFDIKYMNNVIDKNIIKPNDYKYIDEKIIELL